MTKKTYAKSRKPPPDGWRSTSARRAAVALFGLVMLSAACASPQCPVMTLPPKPALAVLVTEAGGMCLSRDDTAALARYIMDLEALAR